MLLDAASVYSSCFGDFEFARSDEWYSGYRSIKATLACASGGLFSCTITVLPWLPSTLVVELLSMDPVCLLRDFFLVGFKVIEITLDPLLSAIFDEDFLHFEL